MDYYQLLANEPMFWSRLGFDPVAQSMHWQKTHRAFAEKGCFLHTGIIQLGWVDVDTYDYAETDRALEAILSASDQILFMPRIKLEPPLGWLAANPSHAARSLEGSMDDRQVAQLFSSFDAEDYRRLKTGTALEGLYLQSFASKKWLQDAGEALRRLIEHIENGPYAERIVAYHLATGMCGENVTWGIWAEPEKWGDYSPVNRQGFYDYCLEEYGSLAQVEQAFGRQGLTPDNIIPTPERRCRNDGTLSAFFRQGAEDARAYSKYVTRLVTGNLRFFAHLVKQRADKPVGYFYGYLQTGNAQESGHLDYEALLSCPDIDFLSAPKCYYRYGAGGPGGTQGISRAVTRRKLWLDELDNDTHVAQRFQEPACHPATFEETRTILWREVARNLSWNNQNFWWMDLLGGFFEDDAIMEEIGRLVSFIRETRSRPHQSVSQILCVQDEYSLASLTTNKWFMGNRRVGVVNELLAELRLCGAPVDDCRLQDLKFMDLSPYRMVVFANTFCVDEETRRVIASMNPQTLKVFNYAAGICRPEYSADNVRDLTGIAIGECAPDAPIQAGYNPALPMPRIFIPEQPGVQVLRRYEDGTAKLARRGNSILIASPELRAADFYALAQQQGVTLYADAGCAVYADSRFTAIFPDEQTDTQVCFDQPRTELVSGRQIAAGESVLIGAKGAAVFVG